MLRAVYLLRSGECELIALAGDLAVGFVSFGVLAHELGGLDVEDLQCGFEFVAGLRSQ
jgi:hypothetical protein